ncbi:MAG: peroxiredoxin [Actinomycetes bacterium]
MTLEIGQMAPDFTLKNQFGEDVTLSQFRGDKAVVLVFYPMAFTGICTGELCEIRDNRDHFVSDDVQVLGISCDTSATLKVFAEQENLNFPLLSDFWPHGEVSQKYGAFFESHGFSLRGTFIIDKAGILQWSVVNGPGDARDSQEYKAALAALV